MKPKIPFRTIKTFALDRLKKLAERNCKKCYGEGQTGRISEHDWIICDCVHKKMAVLQLEHEEKLKKQEELLKTYPWFLKWIMIWLKSIEKTLVNWIKSMKRRKNASCKQKTS